MAIYDSAARCAAAEKIDKKLLLKAKGKGCPGFRNSKVYFDEAKPWLEVHIDELKEEKPEDDISEIKRQNLIKDGRLKDLQIKEKEEELITVEEVSDYLEGFAKTQMLMFDRVTKELPVKISGKLAGDIEIELRKEFKKIINLLQSDPTKWK